MMLAGAGDMCHPVRVMTASETGYCDRVLYYEANNLDRIVQ